MNSPTEKIRLSKLMSEQGLCSRREADAFIERGLVFVDGERITELGTRIDPSQKITLASAAIKDQKLQVTILLNKPIGYVSGQPEGKQRPAVSIIDEASHFQGDRSSIRFSPMQLRGIAPAGRLDIDSKGLLVFTQDGRIAKQLIGENSGMEKEYLVRVTGKLDARGLGLLKHGLLLDGEPLKPAVVNWQNEDQLRFILRQGKKRQIRRMCQDQPAHAVGLHRHRHHAAGRRLV